MCARATFHDADQGFGFVQRSNSHLRLAVIAVRASFPAADRATSLAH